jgi:HAD superfamily hydrolase (TIGR01509 family)
MADAPPRDAVDAVIFDLDGVLLDSETVWDDARRELVARAGGTWRSDATREMMGMSSPEWSAYLRDRLGVPLSAEQISSAVVASVDRRYTERLPLTPGACEAVARVADRWPLGLASSSNRPIIERFLDTSGLRPRFAATVSSEEVGRGKPAPDVYLAAATHLGAVAERCVAIEDSTNGIRAATAARMKVVAVPNRHFPPTPDALAAAVVVLTDLAALTPELIEAAVRP